MILEDRMNRYVLAVTDVPNMIRNWFPDYNPGSNVLCPHHEDKNPSLTIFPDGGAKCHGCDFMAINLIDLYAKMEHLSYANARKDLYEMIVKPVPKGRDMAYNMHLMIRNRKMANWLNTKRLINDTVLLKYKIGMDPQTGRITIPIYDLFGTCVNIRYYSRLKKDRDAGHKMISEKGFGEARLYPEWKMVDEDDIILCEGEMDCLAGRSAGLPTVTWTGGAMSWNKTHEWLFKGKRVLIVYDRDKAGKEGAIVATRLLKHVALDVCEVEIPKRIKGKDLTEWLQDPYGREYLRRSWVEWFRALRSDVPYHIEGVCKYCGATAPAEANKEQDPHPHPPRAYHITDNKEEA